jgi:hypothetical protein
MSPSTALSVDFSSSAFSLGLIDVMPFTPSSASAQIHDGIATRECDRFTAVVVIVSRRAPYADTGGGASSE